LRTADNEIKSNQGKKGGGQENGDFCFDLHFSSPTPFPFSIYIYEKESKRMHFSGKKGI